ncbi:LON peptidase N-terminal domain and RING finger 3-like [Paramuricea clavata]|uniref:LON peptidase N-terminal domain and RING finger 3-like n=1 Tax=Paramuricea clavata TaxID=317549 RepID=A0A7D9ERD1_PARCT|nr:LON peptidase N-terminal domain and RING finger 3-like [Paramuricea clavata]
MFDPTNHFILGNLSHVYLVLEEYQTALDYADRACKKIPNWEKGFYRKAQAYVGLKNYSQAAVWFLKVLLVNPQNDIAHKSLTKVFVEVLTKSTNPSSQNTAVIDDLASSLDGLIEVHGGIVL